MTNKKLLAALTLGGISLALSCDGGTQTPTTGLATDDCVVGMFRPEGLADCVFPADDQNGTPLSVSDNRCAEGQPAVPPACVNDAGGRAYLAATSKCAPNYRYEPGTCDRGGAAGFEFNTGAAGAAGAIGVSTGEAGTSETGFGTGAAGSFGDAGSTVSGAGGGPSTGSGTAGSTLPVDASAADAMSLN